MATPTAGTATLSPRAQAGHCTASGFSATGVGPNCTFVGRRQWHRSSLLVGSCARNVRQALDAYARAQVTSLLDAIATSSAGGGGGALIFEDEQRSGDPDGTRMALRSWAAADSRVRLLLAQPLLYPRWSRTQRLALCRNMLAHEAARLPEHGVYIGLDLDCRTPSAAEVLHVLSSMLAWRAAPAPPAAAPTELGAPSSYGVRRWDVLTANTRAPAYYYDRWALRARSLTLDYDCWFNNTRRKVHGSCPEYAITIDPQAAPLRVESAFNGLGLYRAAAVRAALEAQCRYRGTKNSYLCEHVPFHTCMTEHRMAIGVLPALSVHCGRTDVAPLAKRVALLANGTVRVRDGRSCAVEACCGQPGCSAKVAAGAAAVARATKAKKPPGGRRTKLSRTQGG